jgi:hypothetical protein
MARIEILLHNGCLCEQGARELARAIQQEFPAWEICVRPVTDGEAVSCGAIVLPAFLLEGQVLATGIPNKQWLVAKLKEWEQVRR